MRLSEIQELLSRHQIRLTRSLGQNFLHDGNQLRRIVRLAEVGPTDRVLEIGPGLGPLTELLLEHAGEVLAIEKDQRLVEVLRQRLNGRANLRLLHGDALEYLRGNHDWHDWKVVANLPYSVASPLLVELAQHPQGPSRIVVTLQHEVVQRITARPGTEAYGLLTLLIQPRYDAVGSFRIAPTCFFPPPAVESACVGLSRCSPPRVSPDLSAKYVRIVRRAFSQRRKMMLKLLGQVWPKGLLAAAFAATGVSPTVRAEDVTLDQFRSLAEHLGDAPADFHETRDL